MPLQEDERLCSQICPRLNAELLHLCRGDRSYPVEPADWQRRDEVGAHLRRDDELAIRFALAGRQLGEELVIGDAGRRGETDSWRMRPRISFAVADAVCNPRRSCVTSR